jgi:hypothetical protein
MIRNALSIIVSLFLFATAFSLQAQHYNQVVFIDSQSLGEKSKRDTFRVGNSGGEYSGIQVETIGAANVIKRITVRFEDRSSQTFNDSQLKMQAQRSDILWFRSGNQVIDRVSVLYNPEIVINEGAEIKLYGLR